MFNWLTGKRKNWSDEEYQLYRDYTKYQIFQVPGFLDEPTVCEINPDFDLLSEYFRGNIAFLSDDIYVQLQHNERCGYEKIKAGLIKVLKKNLTPRPDLPVYIVLYLGHVIPTVYKVDRSKPFVGLLADCLVQPGVLYLDKAYELSVKANGKEKTEAAVKELMKTGLLITTDLDPYIKIQMFDEWPPVTMDIVCPPKMRKRQLAGKKWDNKPEDLEDLPFIFNPEYGGSIQNINRVMRILNRKWYRDMKNLYNKYPSWHDDPADPARISHLLSGPMERKVNRAMEPLDKGEFPDVTRALPERVLYKNLQKWSFSKRFHFLDAIKPQDKGATNASVYFYSKDKNIDEKEVLRRVTGPKALYENSICEILVDYMKEKISEDELIRFTSSKHYGTFSPFGVHNEKQVWESVKFPTTAKKSWTRIKPFGSDYETFTRLYFLLVNTQGIANNFYENPAVREKYQKFQNQWLFEELKAYSCLYTDIDELYNKGPGMWDEEARARMLFIQYAPEMAHLREKMMETGIAPRPNEYYSSMPKDSHTDLENPSEAMRIPSPWIPGHIYESMVPENLPILDMHHPLDEPLPRHFYWHNEVFPTAATVWLAMKRAGIKGYEDERFKDCLCQGPLFLRGPNKCGESIFKAKEDYCNSSWFKDCPKFYLATQGIMKYGKHKASFNVYASYYHVLQDLYKGDEEKLLKDIEESILSYQRIVSVGEPTIRYMKKIDEEKKREKKALQEQERKRKALEEKKKRQEEERKRKEEEEKAAKYELEQERLRKEEAEKAAQYERELTGGYEDDDRDNIFEL